jgi:hypothetical protein
MAKGTTIMGIVLALILAGGTFFLGWFYANDWQFGGPPPIDTSPTLITPTIDGIIGETEWLRSSYYNVPFYLDVDNEPNAANISNVDGWNYISVAEDNESYYIALDLCSDRTNDKKGEWIAYHLANRLPDTMNSKLAFYALEDLGYEYLFYNVTEEEVFDNEMYSIAAPADFYDIPIDPLIDTIDVFRGNTSGDFYDFWTLEDNKNLTGTSSYFSQNLTSGWLAGDFLDIHFAVDIEEKFPDVDLSTFMSTLIDMDLNIRLRSSLASNPIGHFGTANEYYFGVAEHGGTPGDMDNSVTFLSNVNEFSFPADTNVNLYVDLDHTTINPSTGMFYFTIHCWNDEDVADPTDYEIFFDKISLKFTTDYMQSIVGKSIANSNFDIAFGFNSSVNCNESHRMFEFKVAKAEFPTLDDEFLYLNIAGYGTMAMEGTNYWMEPKAGFPLPPTISSISDKRQFMTFDMSIT